jgi:hypothetical protein
MGGTINEAALMSLLFFSITTYLKEGFNIKASI